MAAGCIDSEKFSSQENLRLSFEFLLGQSLLVFSEGPEGKKTNKEVEVFAESKQIESGIK